MTRTWQLVTSELAARVVTRNCQLVTIWDHRKDYDLNLPAGYIRAGSKGCDSELPASYHRGMALLRQAEKKRLKGSGENVAESTPQDIDSFYLVDSDILSQCCMGQWGPSVPWHMVHLNNTDMMI